MKSNVFHDITIVIDGQCKLFYINSVYELHHFFIGFGISFEKNDHTLEHDMRFLDLLLSNLLFLQTWDLYERKELVGLIDTSLNGEFDAEQACKFLKIGLLCTQESPKSRPSMSTVVKMLTGEMKVDDSMMTKPALISDFMDLKVRQKQESITDMKTSSSYNTSSASEHQDTTIISAATSTFTTQYDHSM